MNLPNVWVDENLPVDSFWIAQKNVVVRWSETNIFFFGLKQVPSGFEMIGQAVKRFESCCRFLQCFLVIGDNIDCLKLLTFNVSCYHLPDEVLLSAQPNAKH
jgi:hypothetical protein